MFTFIKKTRTTFALLLWFVFVFLIAYFSPGRTIESNLTAGSTKGSMKSTRMRPATPAPSDSLSLDSDNDGTYEAAVGTASVSAVRVVDGCGNSE